jgi:trimeric autotransporter adhesin
MKTSLLRLIVLAAATASVSLPLAAQSSYAINRVVAPIDETNLVTLKGNVHPLAQARYDRGPAPESTPTGRILLTLARSADQQQALTQYLADLQNPSSPNYHKWLTPAQYGAQYGISDADLQTVEGWLEGHGFKIEKVPQARNVIEFSGSFGQLESAFHTSMHSLVVNGENHVANMTDPQIPAALASVVAGVGPLNDFHPRPGLVMGPRGHYDAATHTLRPDLTLTNNTGTVDYLYVDPADAATIYDTPNTALNANYKSGATWDGTGIRIGIAGDSDVNPTDVGLYRYAFINNQGTAATNVPTVVVDGNDPGYNGDELEALLDNEVAGGLAPGASLYFYTSANTDISAGLFNAIFRALDDNTVSILNISFISCEAGLETQGNQLVLAEAEQAAAQGISITVAAGDSGSAGCDNDNTETAAQNGLAVNGLASTPYTIAVGGTDYDVLASAFSTYVSTDNTAPHYGTALNYIPEEPWNNSTSVNTTYSANVAEVYDGETDIVAGGGGSSSVYSKPAFQTSVTPNDKARDLPDVSFLAGNGFYNTTWVLCGDSAVEGATSGSEPPTYDCETTSGDLSDASTFYGVGGTSAAAPAFAGMLALVAQSQGGARLGQVDPVLYGLAANSTTYASVFHDVKVGNNSVVCASGSSNCGTNGFLEGYNAVAGYDLASGLGSVNVKALISNWTNVKPAATTTTFNINGSTSAYSGTHGKSLTFNVGVTPSTATGVVGIVDNANLSSGGTLNNGQFAIPLSSGAGTMAYNGLPGGSYTVTARYGGDASDASSTSAAITVDISAENSATSLEVNAYSPLTGEPISTASIPYGSQVNFDASIAGTNASEANGNTQGVATGTVTFNNGSTALGTATLATGNLASWPPITSKFAVLTAGSYSVTAAYSGDPSFNKSTSAPTAFTVAKATTQAAAAASPASISSTGTSTVTLTITTPYNLGVAGYGAAPTGTVTLTGNSATLATVNLSSFTGAFQQSSPYNFVLTGTATVQGSALATGSNTITAKYSGDTNYAGSTTTTSLTVTGPPSFSLASTGGISISAGNSGSTQLAVTPAGGFTGQVNFACSVNGNPTGLTCSAPSVKITGTAAVNTNLTVASTAAAPTGNYTATVTASDAATGKITSTATVAVSVSGASAPGLLLTSSGNISIDAGATSGNTSTITVAPVGGFTGAVNLKCVVTPPSGATSPATCSLASSSVTLGAAAVTDTLTVATTATTSAGDYSVVVTGADAATGLITNNVTVMATVSAYVAPSIALTDSGAITVSAGNTGTSTITVTPSGGFTGAVNLTCAVTTSISNPNDPPTCTIPSSVTISGTTAATATLSIGTVETTGGSASAVPPLGKFFLGGGATLAMLFFLGMPARRRAWRSALSVVAILFVAGAMGCGGGGGSKIIEGTTPGTYTATVTGTDAATGKITASVAVTVTVNQLAP